MPLRAFSQNDILLVGDALDIAEDATGNFFKLSLGQWKKYRYDVKTLCSLNQDEIKPDGFAFLNKGIKVRDSAGRHEDFYSICLQDHMILKAINRDKELKLLSLLVYVFTHELVHIVRFCNYMKRYDVLGEEKDEVEKAVHETTYNILKDLSVPNLMYILESYKHHRLPQMIFI